MRLADYLRQQPEEHVAALAPKFGAGAVMGSVVMFVFGEHHRIIGRPGTGLNIEVPDFDTMIDILRTEAIRDLAFRSYRGLSVEFIETYRHNGLPTGHSMLNSRVLRPSPHVTSSMAVLPNTDYALQPTGSDIDAVIARVTAHVTYYSLTGSWDLLQDRRNL
jgi:hypothetical protein